MNTLQKWIRPNRLSRWEPLGELENIRGRMDDLMNDFWSPSLWEGNGATGLSAWEPSVNISEDDNEFVVEAELPELKREGITVQVEDGRLSISGERKFEKEEKKKKYHRIERSYGSFYRSFVLPGGVDSSKVNAGFKDGILKIHLPKSEQIKQKVHEIKIS